MPKTKRTKQDLFDEVARKLRAQGRPSGEFRDADEEQPEPGSEFVCLYRSPDGCKCGIGQIIPDENYRPEMENRTASTVLTQFEGVIPDVPDNEENRGFLDSLQAAHDRAAEHTGIRNEIRNKEWLAAWIDRMEYLAHMHNLSTAALTEDLPDA